MEWRVWRDTATLIAAVAGLMYSGCSRHTAERADHTRAKTLTAATIPAVRKIYSYSLIPGGVENAAAFRRYRSSDPVLTRHFQGVGDRLSTVTAFHDQWMYASYRVANVVYWTKDRVLVHAGETLLTDGRSLIRGRCGNRLSESPNRPVQTFTPPAVTGDHFNTEIALTAPPPLAPNFALPELPVLPAVAPPEVATPALPEATPVPPFEQGPDILPLPVPLPPDSGGSVYLPPSLTPITLPMPTPRTPVVPVLPIPEPQTWVLSALGAACVAVLSAQKTRRL